MIDTGGSFHSRGIALSPEATLGDIAEAEVIDNGVITHDGVARVFARRFGGQLKYCHHAGAWFKWTGERWQRDETDCAFQYARMLGREMTSGNSSSAERKEARKVSFAGGVERFARGDPAFTATSEDWDADPMLLGTPGGTVDLRDGRLRPADPADGITKLCAVTPVEGDCPIWLTFLHEATGGDEDLIRFIQQWAGYSLTGDTREHALAFLHGDGGNGKSVCANTLSGIAGDYSVTSSMDTFVASRNDRHPTDLAMLRGARMVTASETEEGRAWAESRIKQLTGGDRISARFMRQDFFEFRPQFKLLILGNHKPVLRNVDNAMRRRFCILPFTRKPSTPDPLLEEKLKAEWPAILAWMIKGCLDWQANGLIRPACVLMATEEYFAEADVFQQWLDDECTVELGNNWKRATAKELFESWRKYADAAGEPPETQRAFAQRMRKKGFTPYRGTRGKREYSGICLQR